MRPQDWTKNLFVLIPIIFWLGTGDGAETTTDYRPVVLAVLAFAAFCLVASAVYCFNDAFDAEKDRTHPVKRLRPVASGAISPRGAMMVGLVSGLCGLGIAAFAGFGVLVVLLIYLVLQVAYNGGAKYVVLVDVVVIALGFALRAAAGAFAIDDQLSIWLLLCVFFLCLFLGFTKRLCDHSSAAREPDSNWKSPAGYDDIMELNWLLAVSAVLSIMMYLTYALSTHTYQLFGSGAYGIALLTPVLIAMQRFYRRALKGQSDSPMQALLQDRVVQIGVALYCVGVLASLCSQTVRGLLGELLINREFIG